MTEVSEKRPYTFSAALYHDNVYDSVPIDVRPTEVAGCLFAGTVAQPSAWAQSRNIAEGQCDQSTLPHLDPQH